MQIIAGADKFQILDRLVDKIQERRLQGDKSKVIVIVPDNRKLSVEQALLQVDQGALLFTEVLSIKRFASLLFKEVLSRKQQEVSPELAALLIYNYVQDLSERNDLDADENFRCLSIYFNKPEFREKLLETEKSVKRLRLDLSDLSSKLADYTAPQAQKLRRKLQALQELSEAYRLSLAEAELTDTVGEIDELINLLRDFAFAAGNSDKWTQRHLQFLRRTHIYFYGMAEDTLITPQEWQLINCLQHVAASLTLTLKLPDLTADYQGKEKLAADLAVSLSSGESSAENSDWKSLRVENLRCCSINTWLEFAAKLPYRAAKIYEAGFRALFDLYQQDFTSVSLEYLLPAYTAAKKRVEAWICQLEANAPLQDLRDDSVVLRRVSEKKTAFCHILREIKQICTSGGASACQWQDCAVILADYVNDLPDLLMAANEINVPLYLGEGEQQSCILSAYLHNLWKLLNYGLNRTYVLAFLRSPLLPFSENEIATYENYLIRNNLNYHDLLQFAAPKAEAENENDDENEADLLLQADLQLAGKIAHDILLPLAELQKQLRSAENRPRRLHLLLQYFIDCKLEDTCRALYLQSLQEPGAFVQEAARTLVGAFNKFARHLHDLLTYSRDLEQETLSDFLRSLELDFQALENEILPNPAFQVWVSGLEKAQGTRFKQIYLVNFTATSLMNSSGFAGGVFSRNDLTLLLNLAEKNCTVALDSDAGVYRCFVSWLYDALLLAGSKVVICTAGKVEGALTETLSNYLSPAESIGSLTSTKLQVLPNKPEICDYLRHARSLINLIIAQKMTAAERQRLQKLIQADFAAAYCLLCHEPNGAAGALYQTSVLSVVSRAYEVLPLLERAAQLQSNLQTAVTATNTTYNITGNLRLISSVADFQTLDGDLITRLLKRKKTLSINELECYAANPFVFFCRYLLALQEKAGANTYQKNFGILLHAFAEEAINRIYAQATALAAEEKQLEQLTEMTGDRELWQFLQADKVLEPENPANLQLHRSFAPQLDAVYTAYQALVAAYSKDYSREISILRYNSSRFSQLADSAVLEKHLADLQAAGAIKAEIVNEILQTAESKIRNIAGLSTPLYRETVRPQLLKIANFGLSTILRGAMYLFSPDIKAVFPATLESRFMLPLKEAQRQVNLLGKIDRIDYCDPLQNRTEPGILLLDYKSGRKKFEAAKLLAGLDLQMPLYANLIRYNLDGNLSSEGNTRMIKSAYMYLQNLYKRNNGSNLSLAWEKSPEDLQTEFTGEEKNDLGSKLTLTEAEERALEDYSYNLCLAEWQDICAGKFPYEPVLAADNTCQVPYQGLAKFSPESGQRRLLLNRMTPMPATVKDKEALEYALKLWQQSAITGEKTLSNQNHC